MEPSASDPLGPHRPTNPIFLEKPTTSTETEGDTEVETSITKLSALQRTGAAFATGLKFLTTGGSLLSFTPSVVGRGWKGVKKSAREVWKGEKKSKTRRFTYVIRNQDTLEALQTKQAEVERLKQFCDDLSSAPDLDGARQVAAKYADGLLSPEESLVVQQRRTQQWAKSEEKRTGKKPPEALKRLRRENTEKFAMLLERYSQLGRQIDRYEQALAKVDTVIGPARGRFPWSKGSEADSPEDVRRVKEGLEEVQHLARLDAENSLKEYNTLISKASFEERQSQWAAGGYTETERSKYANDHSKKFDPYVRESIRNYVENVPGVLGQLRVDSGHHYLVVSEKGGMIFIPNGDMKKITFIRFTEGNKIVTDANKLKRYSRCHMAAYETIEKELTEWLKEHPDLKREYFTTFSYNFFTNMAYVQGVLDPNKPASKQPRKNIKLGGDVWNTIYEIMNPDKTHKPDKLDTPRVYKHSRAEGEREERLARIEAEKAKLRKDLKT
nr:hypothetical protein [Chlamydiota bacterium]